MLPGEITKQCEALEKDIRLKRQAGHAETVIDEKICALIQLVSSIPVDHPANEEWTERVSRLYTAEEEEVTTAGGDTKIKSGHGQREEEVTPKQYDTGNCTATSEEFPLINFNFEGHPPPSQSALRIDANLADLKKNIDRLLSLPSTQELVNQISQMVALTGTITRDSPSLSMKWSGIVAEIVDKFNPIKSTSANSSFSSLNSPNQTVRQAAASSLVDPKSVRSPAGAVSLSKSISSTSQPRTLTPKVLQHHLDSIDRQDNDLRRILDKSTYEPFFIKKLATYSQDIANIPPDHGQFLKWQLHQAEINLKVTSHEWYSLDASLNKLEATITELLARIPPPVDQLNNQMAQLLTKVSAIPVSFCGLLDNWQDKKDRLLEQFAQL